MGVSGMKNGAVLTYVRALLAITFSISYIAACLRGNFEAAKALDTLTKFTVFWWFSERAVMRLLEIRNGAGAATEDLDEDTDPEPTLKNGSGLR